MLCYLLTENSALENVDVVLLHSISKKCFHCNHFGASLVCKVEGCTKMFHYPCATASGAFQELSTVTVLCSQHISQVPSECECKNQRFVLVRQVLMFVFQLRYVTHVKC